MLMMQPALQNYINIATNYINIVSDRSLTICYTDSKAAYKVFLTYLKGKPGHYIRTKQEHFTAVHCYRGRHSDYDL